MNGNFVTNFANFREVIGSIAQKYTQRIKEAVLKDLFINDAFIDKRRNAMIKRADKIIARRGVLGEINEPYLVYNTLHKDLMQTHVNNRINLLP